MNQSIKLQNPLQSQSLKLMIKIIWLKVLCISPNQPSHKILIPPVIIKIKPKSLSIKLIIQIIAIWWKAWYIPQIKLIRIKVNFLQWQKAVKSQSIKSTTSIRLKQKIISKVNSILILITENLFWSDQIWMKMLKMPLKSKINRKIISRISFNLINKWKIKA